MSEEWGTHIGREEAKDAHKGFFEECHLLYDLFVWEGVEGGVIPSGYLVSVCWCLDWTRLGKRREDRPVGGINERMRPQLVSFCQCALHYVG